MEAEDHPDRAPYWNRVADEKTFSHPIDAALLREVLPTRARILDFGCGYGRSLADLARRGYTHLVGVDTSRAMIERGRRLFPTLDLRAVEPGPLPFEPGTFDAVLMFAVLTSTPEDEGQRSLINEVRRLLVPGGVLYLSDLWLQEDDRNVERYRAGEGRFERYGVFETGDGGRFRHHDREWMEELTRPFEQVRARDQVFTTMNGNAASGFQWICRKGSGSAGGSAKSPG